MFKVFYDCHAMREVDGVAVAVGISLHLPFTISQSLLAKDWTEKRE